MSELNARCIETWRRIMPEYEIKQWNEANSPLDAPYAQAAYARGLWSKVSNYVRLQALFSEGGIYLDTDVEVVKDFAPLLLNKCFVGFQQQLRDVDWVNNAVLGAEPGHEFLKRCLEWTERLYSETAEFPRSPFVTTRVLKEMGLREYGLCEIGEVTVYPAEYFFPYPWFGRFSPSCVRPETYCIHHWEGTWNRSEYFSNTLRRAKLKARAALARSFSLIR